MSADAAPAAQMMIAYMSGVEKGRLQEKKKHRVIN